MTSTRASVLLPIIVILALIVTQVVTAPDPSQLLFLLGNDDSMRLVNLKDLDQGQGWRDLMQYRLGLPGGFEMHWSRLVDGALLSLRWALGLFGSEQAAARMLVLWPLIWFAVAALLLWRSAARLGGPLAAAFVALIGATLLISDQVFRPGAVDHHNIQIALFLITLCGLLSRQESRLWPAAAGLAMGFSLAIGVETMPHLALLAVCVAVLWAFAPKPEAHGLAWFGAGLITSLLIAFAAFLPPSALSGGYCDAMSVDLAVPLSIGALGLIFVSRTLSSATFLIRVAGLGAVAVAAAGVALTVYPACLTNPLDQLDPFLETRWLAFVAEAHGAGDVFAGRAPTIYAGYYVYGAAALLLSAIYVVAKPGARGNWALLFLAVAAALGFSIYQIRGVILLSALSVLPVSVLAADLLEHRRNSGNALWALLAILLAVASVPAIWARTAALFVPASQNQSAEVTLPLGPCLTSDAVEALAKLETGLIATNSNLGAQILLHSDHRTLSAPYHRNQAGMRAALEILLAPTPRQAYAKLVQYEVDYVGVCTADPELTLLSDGGFAGLGIGLTNGVVPIFLAPVFVRDDQPLKLYRVLH